MNQNEFISRLKACIATVPALRFGQFMSNIQYMLSDAGIDMFYISDEELIKYIEEYVRNLVIV